MTTEETAFLFLTCQVGTENACKRAISERMPWAKLAFSRPGCLTFKYPIENHDSTFQELARIPFARAYGQSLERISGSEAFELADQVLEIIDDTTIELSTIRHLHVWERDKVAVGHRGFEPTLTALAQTIGNVILEKLNARIENPSLNKTQRDPSSDDHITELSPADHRDSDNQASDDTQSSRPAKIALNRSAVSGDMVLDVVLIEPNEWLIGVHYVATNAACWPGGVPFFRMPDQVVSRAYLKTMEAIKWSGIPIRTGDRIAEIGSAPGGSCQAFLEKGLNVIGIDPAEMEPEISAHPNFEHWRMRGDEIKRKSLANVRWLVIDTNVPPQQSLDMIGELVTHSAVKIDGFLLTLKMANWSLADQIPEYLSTIKAWGYQHIRIRHLAHNRNELCLFALRKKALLRVGRNQASAAKL